MGWVVSGGVVCWVNSRAGSGRADDRHPRIAVDANEFVIAVRADVANGEGSVRREFALKA